MNQGVTFRDAYKQVGSMIEKGEFSFDLSKGLHHTHEGSIGNLCNAEIELEMSKQIQKFN
jgi:argininosuccinate lyase